MKERILKTGTKIKMKQDHEEDGNKFDKGDTFEVIDTEPQSCSTICLNKRQPCTGKVIFKAKGTDSIMDLTFPMCMGRTEDELPYKIIEE